MVIIDTRGENEYIKISYFPDGQIGANCIFTPQPGERYLIASSVTSYNDLFTIIAANDALIQSGANWVGLYCPYLLGARGDKRFAPTESFDLKIITDILNSASFDKIWLLDVHSDVALALLKNSINIPPIELISSWVKYHVGFDDAVIISPDAGAYKKLSKMNLPCPMIAANKNRNHLTGEITTEIYTSIAGKNCIIVDDICDGGRTFIQLGGRLKELGASTVTLVVIHGIFSNGFELTNIDRIITTNSYYALSKLESALRQPVFNVFSHTFIRQYCDAK